MTDIQVGDKVRLATEGVVTGVGGNGTYIYFGDRGFRRDAYKEVEVIEKAKPKPKVGDMISADLYKALPAGAVMKGDNLFVISDGKGNLVTQEGRILDAPWTARTLVFLP